MKRIVINIDHAANIFKLSEAPTANRVVVRTDKICGLIENADGTVELTIRVSENAPTRTIYILNSFDEVAEAMMY